MRRERANDLAAEIARLRGAAPLDGAKREQARTVAALWLEQDARNCLLDGAPQDVRTAMHREYARTGFLAESVRVFDNGYRMEPSHV